MKQPASSEVLRYLAALLCPSSEMFSICDAKFFSSSGLYDYTLSLNRSFKLQDIFLNFIVSSKIKQHLLSPKISARQLANPRLQAKITENTKSTRTTKNKVGIQCSILHSLSTTIKLAQYR